MRSVHFFVRATILSVVLASLTACSGYMKMNPPPDADKPGGGVDNSCYLATAANMLAGAGYGDGANVQARANDIYGDLTTQFGVANGGWTDTALTWWLSSTNNTWTANPYTVVTVYGNKNPKNPWANANGARFVGNELRRCQFVGLSISWPSATAGQVGTGGHAITAWGDGSASGVLSSNPSDVVVTDSDRDTGGDTQTYAWDAYTNPNPGGANEGNGWYLNYDANHPYVKHIIALCSTDDPSDATLTQKVFGSYEITQTSETPATDLHYRASTDVDILSYRTWISYPTTGAPRIAEAAPRRSINVDWDFAKPVQKGKTVRINTEFVVPRWNAITYSDVHFTYPDSGDGDARAPNIGWAIETPMVEKAITIRDVTGGYVVGAFDVIGEAGPPASYRFVHQYSFDQDPERHRLQITGRPGTSVANVRVGHHYGLPTEAELWSFEEWMSRFEDRQALGEEAIGFDLDWEGRLPYPAGEDIQGAQRQRKARDAPR